MNIVSASFNASQPKVKADEELRYNVVAYLLNAAQKTVYISRGTGEKFNCNDSLPKDMVKGKLLYIKKRADTVFKEKDDNDKACSEDGDAKSIKPELMFTSGELDNGGYVNQMYYTTTFTFDNLLMNHKNMQGEWPKIVLNDLAANCHKIKNNTDVIRGLMKGETVLSLPIHMETLIESANSTELRDIDQRVIYAIETIVIDWAKQIHKVLKLDSGSPLLKEKNANPLVEIKFWKAKEWKLKNIYKQMTDLRVSKITTILVKIKSCYLPSFRQLFMDVCTGLKQAESIVRHLIPLEDLIEGMLSGDVFAFQSNMEAIMHQVALIWFQCPYYRPPARIIVLLKEVCNVVAQVSRGFLDTTSLFDSEVEESLWNVTKVMNLLEYFKVLYDEYREVYIPEMVREGGERKASLASVMSGKASTNWDFASHLVFAKYDTYIARVQQVKHLFEIACDFHKLEKLEACGTNGRVLSAQIESVFEDFVEAFKIFAENGTYDPLEPDSEEFDKDMDKFDAVMEDLDSRLASIACGAFENCSSVEARFKMIDSFGSLLDRKLVLEVFSPLYIDLVNMYSSELDSAKRIFDAKTKNRKRSSLNKRESNIALAKVHKNLPMLTGRIKWLKELEYRVKKPYEEFQNTNSAGRKGLEVAMQTDDAEDMRLKYEEMLALLSKAELKVFTAWCKQVEQKADFNLDKYLINRVSMWDIECNFDPELMAILRNVKFLEQLNQKETVPGKAQELFVKYDTYLRYTQNLILMTDWYKKILQTANKWEYDLIEPQIDKIDEVLKVGEETLTWKNEQEVWPYIEKIRDLVKDLESRHQKAKDNLSQIETLGDSWKVPLFDRKDGKSENLLDLDNRADRVQKRYEQIKANGVTILELIEDSRKQLRAEEDQGEWLSYLEMVDNKVAIKFKAAVEETYHFLIHNTDPDALISPLFEVKLFIGSSKTKRHLEADPLRRPGVMYFEPSLEVLNVDEKALQGTFARLFHGLIEDVLNMAMLLNRISKNAESVDYRETMMDFLETEQLRMDLIERLPSGVDDAKRYRDELMDKYSFLWMQDMEEVMNQFLTYGKVFTEEELLMQQEDNSTSETVESLKEREPTLDDFRERIDFYNAQFQTLQDVDSSVVFENWLRVDVKPFRHSALQAAKKWASMFKNHLLRHVQTSLEELASMIEEADKGLVEPITDYNALVTCMSHLTKIREKQAKTDTMFGPLAETVEMLKSYKVEISDDIYDQLEHLPDKWDATKKIALTKKQEVGPLQAEEVTKVRKSVAKFDKEQEAMLKEWRKVEAFQYTATDPYKNIDEMVEKVHEKMETLKEIQDSAKLFEVGVPDFKALKLCLHEARLLKNVWDHVDLMKHLIDEWTSSKWMEMDLNEIGLKAREFSATLRAMDKQVKEWHVYKGVEDNVKNLLKSLSSVTELRSPSIRNRHWNELMRATGVKIIMTDETQLKDLLALNLHKYEDEVKNIVDKADKEEQMGKAIAEYHKFWDTSDFVFEPAPNRKDVQVIKTDPILMETLEDNQVQLQNMMQSRFVDHFRGEVTEWLHKLTTADSVIQMWFDAQRQWSNLENIFLGSEDLRKRLKEDSKRFDKIDAEFKEMMEVATQEPNVIKCTNKRGQYEQLEKLLEGLSKCQKALSNYLETKRLAFPRFYFVAPADLLDILSNSNNPRKVCRHLSKLFDSIAKLEFEEGSKKAFKMISKDTEEMFLDETCDCVGEVEDWLGLVEKRMKASVKLRTSEAVNMYEEKARDQWIFDWAAQPALTTTQIYWTSEVNQAFAKLEEGYEMAMKEYNKKQISQLKSLIDLLLDSKLSHGDREKIMTICTIDVHARDIVGKLIASKIESALSFTWLCQLRHRFDFRNTTCYGNICDAQFSYWYEYLGNTRRLVITPLTDRCYITLTQALNLILGGAPAGPAGTGKTETTKDLGKALGMMVYVYNCSEQMDYKSIGSIFKGLALCGAWGCFDEFNRISVEVLSVVATQVRSIQDGIRDKKPKFSYMGEIISLEPTVGLFITMNPGYAGRAELPENLKALFRPCAMVVPDFALIAEIMLVAEAFSEAKFLAQKFIRLYELCRELLSKQDHYDWGLRAIKSVLVVAGALRRADPDLPEEQVLMRALRDFNVPKITTDDLQIFLGLIGDLFPSINVPRKRNKELESLIKRTALKLRLQPEDAFITKCVQLQELIDVRHSVFVLGNAGTGKSQVLKTLFNTYKLMYKKKPHMWDLDPKAVSNNELFGYVVPATQEWSDGQFSWIMRTLANIEGNAPKWIVLDGDIDPMWIESLNTVMDDNKVLTLASNERIPLNPSMRLMFEISHLKTATPATVSRAGILFINALDVGWKPMVDSWIETRDSPIEKGYLPILFDKYVNMCLEVLRARNYKKVTPITDIAHVEMLIKLLSSLLKNTRNLPVEPPNPKDLLELYFVWACVWAFGAQLTRDQVKDYREVFSIWFSGECKHIKFPQQGTVFDYYIKEEAPYEPKSARHEPKFNWPKFAPWSEKVTPFEMQEGTPIQSMLVHTVETVRLRYFMDMLMDECRFPVMLVGASGSGKTQLIKDKLAAYDSEETISANVPFNYYTTSEMLQRVLEKPLEKKAGRSFGPPGMKRLVYFVDDMNMPEVDKYFTVQPHTILRQCIDYGHWYDRMKPGTIKEITEVQFSAAMNPTAGSFTIDSRLQRHFAVFAVSFPSDEACTSIYQSILVQHLQLLNAHGSLTKYASTIVEAALTLHGRVSQMFLPTAVKFHYIFNLRDLSNVFQGFLMSTLDCLTNKKDMGRLWVHESRRVYRDKLVDEKDIAAYDQLEKDTVAKVFEEPEEIRIEPLVFCHFSQGLGDSEYNRVKKFDSLKDLIHEALDSYNDMNAAMNLVLFEDAILHVCRINRILETSRGYALLIGVGGSGKQSLARLSAFIANIEVFQLQLRQGYGTLELKTDLALLCQKTAIKNIPTMFLMTDAQVGDERFLVLINDLLASGDIPDLFAEDEVETIMGAMKSSVKSLGLMDTRENCWKVFIGKVQANLKVVLSFSPVGSVLRVRARRFPAIISCTSIDWFHPWPYEALLSVSDRFLQQIPQLKDLPDAKKKDLLDASNDFDEGNSAVDRSDVAEQPDQPGEKNGDPTAADNPTKTTDEKAAEPENKPEEDAEKSAEKSGTGEENEGKDGDASGDERPKSGKEVKDDKGIEGSPTPTALRASVSEFMAYAHESVNVVSKTYFENEKRHNYTTPKSFLELIKLYGNLLKTKYKELEEGTKRLSSGLNKLKSTTSQVDKLKNKLAKQEVEVKQRNIAAEELIQKVGSESAKVATEKATADEEEAKVAVIKETVAVKQKLCEADLKKAEPALIAAAAALNTLNKTNLTELKAFPSPPPDVVNVMAGVMVLFLGGPKGVVPKDRSWMAAKKMMGKVDEFLANLKNYNKDNIHDNAVKAMQQYLNDKTFNRTSIEKKSLAAGGLCEWVINICKYNEVFRDVKPKRDALAQANKDLQGAKEKLVTLKALLKELDDNLAVLGEQYAAVTAEKAKCQAEADETAHTVNLANRLISGLESESVRWKSTLQKYEKMRTTLIGDVLVTSACVSYLGCFSRKYREELMYEKWPFKLNSFPDECKIQTTEGQDPFSLLTDGAQMAQWENEGLPGDKMSNQNASILTNCERWPLMIDPQLQGIKWIKKKYHNDEKFTVVRFDQKGYLDVLEKAVCNGETVLIENIDEDIDPILDPIIGRNTIRKNTAIKIGDKEIAYNHDFRLILQTKLSNPHYKPELQAQTTLINFTVTQDGLEDQLLEAVVSKERPDLEQSRFELTQQKNEYVITLKRLEDNLLARLSAAKGNFLDDTELVENLESTRSTALEIEEKQKLAQETEVEISSARENYRPAAARAALLYFILNDLHRINPMYQFSLKAFTIVFVRAIETTTTEPTEGSDDYSESESESESDDEEENEGEEKRAEGEGEDEVKNVIVVDADSASKVMQGKPSKPNFARVGSRKMDESKLLKDRVENLTDSITRQTIVYTTRGLFEKDKFIFKVLVAFKILQHANDINKTEMDFLLKCPSVQNAKTPVDFLTDLQWGSLKSLSQMSDFYGLDRDIEGSAKRWKKFVESECIEQEKFPTEWKGKTLMQRLCMIRVLRPDRMIYAIEIFICEKLGEKYKENRHIPFRESLKETSPAIPIFFILSPGVDPLVDVEAAGRKMGFTANHGNFHSISLGQGQDTLAENALKTAAKKGHWVILQNVHLVAGWLPRLEKMMNQLKSSDTPEEEPHKDYRVFISAEPPPAPEMHIIPQGLLEDSVKITNEPPTKISANLHKAMDNFSQETMESCSKETEFKSILFSLCYFHAVVNERKKFGSIGWNRNYPFSTGDLTICAMILNSYLEANQKVPWEDLRYLFGEIMYGGHITDDWDRRLCRTYLEEYMGPEQLDGDLTLAPGFQVPGNMDYEAYHSYIDDCLPQESPALYGLHINAEIGFLTTAAESLFGIVLELQPRDTSSQGSSEGQSREEIVYRIIDDISERIPEGFKMSELMSRDTTDGGQQQRSPYEVVCLQECERVNELMGEIDRSTKELLLGLKGELTISSAMEDLMNSLYLDKVPDTWQRYPSSLGLGAWFNDLLQRSRELEMWAVDFNLPPSVWMGGLFNPQSFLTAIMQQTARKNDWPLDKMELNCDVTKKNKEDFNAPPREGAYVNSVMMEGARWDMQHGCIMESRIKELTPSMPVMYLKAVLADKRDLKGTYGCPVYKTKQRGVLTYVWTFHLKIKDHPAKWVLRGTALLLNP
ncbi:dynein beta chain, ciliary-like isoform X2 [Convolutriloba macropyga]|uniref:dynein beta chain, ciliary-like isoform X2 n=1 Tax=Convolutriloba macropyga TaxID=536237 RepID=UPI003F521675